MIYDPFIDRLTVFFTGPGFEAEVAEAKNEFFGHLGEGPGDGDNFEMRMYQFLDWYLFSRPLIDQKISPNLWALQCIDFKIDESERLFYANLAEIRHSLFEYIKVSRKTLVVRDLITGNKLQMVDSPVLEGFNREEIFEARIFPHENTFYFTKGFCFHPAEARKFIMKEIKKAKKLDMAYHEELMARLMKMRYKFDRYKHIAIDKIYTSDPRFKI